jgi:hypothetical protein
MKPKRISAAEFDRLFDEGGDVSPYVDRSKARRIHPLIRRVNVDLPYWMVHALDDEAGRLGVTRQSVIKTWLAAKIEERQAAAGAPGTSVRRRHVAESAARYSAKTRRR